MVGRCEERSKGDEGWEMAGETIDREEWAPVMKEAEAFRKP